MIEVGSDRASGNGWDIAPVHGQNAIDESRVTGVVNERKWTVNVPSERFSDGPSVEQGTSGSLDCQYSRESVREAERQADVYQA